MLQLVTRGSHVLEFGKAYIKFPLNAIQKISVIKLNKNTMYLIVAVLVIVIVIAGAAAYLLSNNGNGGTTNPTPTPVPTVSVADATTLQFNLAETSSFGTLNYMFSAKNMNSDTSHIVVRMDIIDPSANYTYVVDTGQEKAWLSLDDGATWTVEADYTADYTMVVTAFNDYITNLEANWNGSDLTYTYTASSGSTILISNISLNPTLPELLFATS